jgi:hypothetical protein
MVLGEARGVEMSAVAAAMTDDRPPIIDFEATGKEPATAKGECSECHESPVWLWDIGVGSKACQECICDC